MSAKVFLDDVGKVQVVRPVVVAMLTANVSECGNGIESLGNPSGLRRFGVVNPEGASRLGQGLNAKPT
jgi:hypothetical protein